MSLLLKHDITVAFGAKVHGSGATEETTIVRAEGRGLRVCVEAFLGHGEGGEQEILQGMREEIRIGERKEDLWTNSCREGGIWGEFLQEVRRCMRKIEGGGNYMRKSELKSLKRLGKLAGRSVRDRSND